MGERDKPHSYRHEPSAPMKNYYLLIMGGSNSDEDGGGVDGDGSGGNSLSRQGAKTETSVPRISSAMVAAWRKFCGRRLDDLGYSRYGEYMGERATSVGAQGGHTMPRRGPALGRAWLGCGRPAACLRLPLGLLCCHDNYKTSGFCPVRFREYFLCRISEIKNSRKQELALRHLLNMLVLENL